MTNFHYMVIFFKNKHEYIKFEIIDNKKIKKFELFNFKLKKKSISAHKILFFFIVRPRIPVWDCFIIITISVRRIISEIKKIILNLFYVETKLYILLELLYRWIKNYFCVYLWYNNNKQVTLTIFKNIFNLNNNLNIAG